MEVSDEAPGLLGHTGRAAFLAAEGRDRMFAKSTQPDIRLLCKFLKFLLGFRSHYVEDVAKCKILIPCVKIKVIEIY